MILAVGVITLSIAGIVVFGISNTENSPHSASAMSELDTIQKSLDDITKKLEALETNTIEDIQQIKTELADIKSISESEIIDTENEIIDTKNELTVALEKSSYKSGDLIQVAGFGKANTLIIGKLINPNSEIITSYSSTSSDSTYSLIFILDKEAKPGNWKLNVTQGDNEETLVFTVIN